jgi:hypothetical protein
MAGSATRRSQSLGINVVAIWKFSCPPQLNNKLTKRMRHLLYGSFGNETWQRLSELCKSKRLLFSNKAALFSWLQAMLAIA